MADTVFGFAGRAFEAGAEGLGLLGLILAGCMAGLPSKCEFPTGLPV